MSTKTYDRNLRSPKFYSTAISGREGNNPEITLYYDINSNLVRIEERSRQDRNTIHMWAQTISGSAFTQNWPENWPTGSGIEYWITTYSGTAIVYNQWGETTYSG